MAKRANFKTSPGSAGVQPTTGGTSGPYVPAKRCEAKRKAFKTGTNGY